MKIALITISIILMFIGGSVMDISLNKDEENPNYRQWFIGFVVSLLSAGFVIYILRFI